MMKIAVIGAGTMGHSLALEFAKGGHQVGITDVSPEMLETSHVLVGSALDTLAEARAFDPAQKEVVMGRVNFTSDLAEAVDGAGFVVEAVVEDAEVKKEMFARLDELTPPEAILASNTSYLDIYKFVETSRPDKVVITHWFAPPHIVPLVEIVAGPQTSQETIDQVQKLHDDLDKTTIVIKKFLPGFVANRLQAALGLEIYKLLDGGYVSPEDLDKAAKGSFILRMPILGVVKRADFAGLDLIQKALSNKSYEPPEVRGKCDMIDELVAQGRRGVKDGAGFYDYGGKAPKEIMHERDLKLLKLRKFLRDMGELD